ncbi:MAG: thymidine phosphorylase [Clostridia bacterium]|nr:thymidine phosphorylase [Clostridia bacterium]
MTLTEIIRKKRDREALTAAELDYVARAAADPKTPDYQLSALLMAMYLNGLDTRETVDLTLAMAHSGDMADLSGIRGVKADKHSTGGVGDKTTLIVAPIAAACGLKVAKMSGRGLGHTGGTVDKLESIPGFQTTLPPDAFVDAVNRTGLCVIGQSGDLCPADKRLYALRDVTETIDSIPLIASSIMSKKLAGGADVIVLDVKCGSGAFMKTPESARAMAKCMVAIGSNAGKKTAALITNMDRPLGNCIGNAIEVREAIGVLSGKGPADLETLCTALAAKMLSLAGAGDDAHCLFLAKDALQSGAAKEKFAAMISGQGGDPDVAAHPEKLPVARYQTQITADRDGFLTAMETRQIGEACALLGAGRQTKDDVIDPAAGIRLYKKTGDPVRRGDVLAELFAGDEALLPAAKARFCDALTFGETALNEVPLIFDTVNA